METLIVVDQHRSQYYASRGKVNGSGRFGSSSSRGFREINCRAFESGSGLLPSPIKAYGGRVSTTPRTNTPSANSSEKVKSVDGKPSKKHVKSSPISINLKGSGRKEGLPRDDLGFSELWAGPAYSNSPPPSSLPIPKFAVKPKRTVSLELRVLESDDLNLQPMAKSAPASPTRESVGASVGFLSDDDFATKTLRRILNLDIADD